MGSAGNKKYSPSSYTHSVLQFRWFSPAADLCKRESIIPEQRPRAEQGQKCTQRHYRTIASASSTVIFQMCKEKDLLILGRGQEHSASHNRAVPCPHTASMHSPPSTPASDQLWHSPYYTSHICQCWQEKGPEDLGLPK